ncbi:amidohydrolase family protein [Aminiphilus sp.]|jgi:5-methylthioadenosine/S-adenosylhomocysteine deaminase|uniref:amidohydrolase family protein n=1 Tax=Aminiphilus sp. TaxID=1872488 RepID=UPI001BD0583F|nr:amidohydrolase family protein [Aminiphilus sp.]
MERIECIVTAPHVFTMAGEGVGYRPDTALAVDGGRILEVAAREEICTRYAARRVLDGRHHALFPGFLDVHMHMSACLLRGMAQDVGNWMMHGFFPFALHLDGEALRAGTRLAVLESLRVGTTTFGEYGMEADFMASLAEEAGFRAQVTVHFRETEDRVYAPEELYVFDEEKGREGVERCRGVFERWHRRGNGRITVLFGPQAPDAVSLESLRRVRELALECGTKVHLHLAQGDRETKQMLWRYGKRPIPWLLEMGFADEHLLAVHLTDATEEEARLVAETGASLALCSGSIGIIDGMVPPAKAFQDAGGWVGLGSDQAPGNNCHNMLNEMKLTALFNKIRYADPEVMPAWKVLRMATVEGARAVGLGAEVGSLEKGKRADFFLLDLRKPTMLPVHEDPLRNIVPNLVYSARGDEISLVAVDGNVLYEEGRFHTLDEKRIVAEAIRLARPLGARGAALFRELRGPNARSMEEGKL